MSLTISPLKQASVSLNPGVWKRSNSSSDDDIDHENGNNFKKARLGYCYNVILESESPQPSDLDSDNESIYSLQDQETEYARDTSDTSTSASTWITLSGHSFEPRAYEPYSGSESDNDITIHSSQEYEPASASEAENPLVITSSSDNEEFIAPNVLSQLFKTDSDNGDDSDDSRTTYDSEISHTDYWNCFQCNATQNNPLYRYCEKCYKLRKSFFPPRPRWNRKRDKSNNKNNKITDNPETTSQILDSGLGSSQGSQESQTSSIISQHNNDNLLLNSTESIVLPSSSSLSLLTTSMIKNNVDTVDSVDTVDCIDFDGKNGNNLERSVSTLSNVSADNIRGSQNDESDKNCMICTVAPKDGAFVHGKTLHICCCYTCAKKVWKKKKNCMICNRKVTNVLKSFYS